MQDRERDLERQVGLARLEREDGGRDPGPVARRRGGERPSAPGSPSAPTAGSVSSLRRRDVGRRQVDVAEDRLVGPERPDARVLQRAADLAERARVAAARWRGRGSAAAGRDRALEDDQVPGRPVGADGAGRVLVRCEPEEVGCSAGRTAPSRGTDRPARRGGCSAPAAAGRSPTPGRRPRAGPAAPFGSVSSARRGGPRSSATSAGTSSTITSALCWASIADRPGLEEAVRRRRSRRAGWPPRDRGSRR